MPTPNPNAPRPTPCGRIVVVGASAGGVEALKTMVATLDPGLPAAVVVVLHIAPAGTSVLPQILARAGRLPVHAVTDGEALRPGQIYVAPPDAHVVVDREALRLSRGPRVNGHRPAIDPTLRSAAQTHEGDVVGVILSGARDDGTAGAIDVKAAGGRVIVQDPHDALFESMPRNVLEHAQPDAVLGAGEIGDWLANAWPATGDEPAHADDRSSPEEAVDESSAGPGALRPPPSARRGSRARTGRV